MSGDIAEMGRSIMRTMQEPILKKLEVSSIGNLSDILFAYSLACLPSTDRMFYNQIEKELHSKFVMKDYFNTLNSTRIQWALSKR
jgi:ABC-type antimicrobial peptide transport system permease subunit